MAVREVVGIIEVRSGLERGDIEVIVWENIFCFLFAMIRVVIFIWMCLTCEFLVIMFCL